MALKQIDTLILDLDNTLFDWFAYWYESFKPIYDAVLKHSGQSVQAVEEDIRQVHQSRRTSEYSFLLEELQVLEGLRKQEDVRALFKDALDKSRQGRDRALSLYPSVFACLWDLKKRGTKIVAYTESMAFYSAYRLKRFGLDGVIDVLFSPQDHEVPSGVSVDKLRSKPEDFYKLQVTRSEFTPPNELKPNPKVLLDIIRLVGADVDRCAYVGDSLFKDVAMARGAGVYDIHAAYGESQRRPEYSLLQRVSHWTADDVERERKITARGHDFEPTVTLKESFAEIYMYCDFVPYSSAGGVVSADQESVNAVEIWKKCVDVQQHFNDLEMRIRNFAITVVGALIAALSFTYQHGLQVHVGSWQLPAGLGLIVAAIFAWGGFFLMDRYWYHVLLRGAVAHASKIEKRYAKTIPEIGLGGTISEASGGVKVWGFSMNSTRRLVAFYAAGFFMLALVFCVLLAAQTTTSKTPTPVALELKKPIIIELQKE